MRMRRMQRRARMMPEIGMTPLIDMALTLLIVFMVTTPVIKNAINVDLPRSTLKEGANEPQELVVSIDKKGDIFFNNVPVTIDQLGQLVHAHVAKIPNGKTRSVWVCVNGKTTTVETLSSVISSVKKIGGIENVKIATQQDSTSVA